MANSEVRIEAAERIDFYSGGLRLAGDMYRPEGASSSIQAPAVVMCHGYNGFRRLFLPAYASRLAAAGYGVLAIDYKGWGDSEGRATRLAPYSRTEDVQAALSYLEGCDWVDARRLGIVGISFGGGTAIHVAAHDRRVKAVVSVGGIGDGERWMRSVRAPWAMRQLAQRAADNRKRLARGQSDEFVSRYEILAFDPASKEIDAASRANTPFVVNELPLEFVWETIEFKPERVAGYVAPAGLLLVTSEADDVVPPEESEAIYAAANEPKRLARIPEIGHDEVYLPHGVQLVMAEVIPWLETYLV